MGRTRFAIMAASAGIAVMAHAGAHASAMAHAPAMAAAPSHAASDEMDGRTLDALVSDVAAGFKGKKASKQDVSFGTMLLRQRVMTALFAPDAKGQRSGSFKDKGGAINGSVEAVEDKAGCLKVTAKMSVGKESSRSEGTICREGGRGEVWTHDMRRWAPEAVAAYDPGAKPVPKAAPEPAPAPPPAAREDAGFAVVSAAPKKAVEERKPQEEPVTADGWSPGMHARAFTLSYEPDIFDGRVVGYKPLWRNLNAVGAEVAERPVKGKMGVFDHLGMLPDRTVHLPVAWKVSGHLNKDGEGHEVIAELRGVPGGVRRCKVAITSPHGTPEPIEGDVIDAPLRIGVRADAMDEVTVTFACDPDDRSYRDALVSAASGKTLKPGEAPIEAVAPSLTVYTTSPGARTPEPMRASGGVVDFVYKAEGMALAAGMPTPEIPGGAVAPGLSAVWSEVPQTWKVERTVPAGLSPADRPGLTMGEGVIDGKANVVRDGRANIVAFDGILAASKRGGEMTVAVVPRRVERKSVEPVRCLGEFRKTGRDVVLSGDVFAGQGYGIPTVGRMRTDPQPDGPAAYEKVSGVFGCVVSVAGREDGFLKGDTVGFTTPDERGVEFEVWVKSDEDRALRRVEGWGAVHRRPEPAAKPASSVVKFQE